jgi:hypothetical protein
MCLITAKATQQLTIQDSCCLLLPDVSKDVVELSAFSERCLHCCNHQLEGTER